MAEQKKVPFDFLNVDLIQKSRFRTKDKKKYFNVTCITEQAIYIGIEKMTYQALFDQCEYFNDVLKVWGPCEKVG